MKRLKMRFKKILALSMSSVMLFSAFLFPELIISASGNAYSAVLPDMKQSSTNNSAYNLKINTESTDLTPEFQSTNLSFGWSGSTMKENNSNYIYLASVNDNTTKNTFKLEQGSAVMFYVKMPASAPENKLFLQLASSTRGDAETYGAAQWLAPLKNKEIFYLKKGSTEWEKRTAPQSSIDSTKGDIVIPAGFEGWIRIPYDNIYKYENKSFEIYRLQFYLKSLGGDYTAGGCTIGNFMFAQDGDKDLLSVTLDGITEKSLYVDFPHHATHQLTPGTVTGADLAENETVFSAGYTYKLSGNSAEVGFDDDTVVSKALLGYIRLPLGSAGRVRLTLNGTDPAGEKRIYIINRGEEAFTAVKTDADGYISLSDGFEGYLLISSDVYGGLKGESVKTLKIESDVTGVSFGSIMLSDNTDPVTSVCPDTGGEYLLFKKAYYNATLLETEDKALKNITDGDYYSVSEKIADKSFGAGLTDGYYYEAGVGSAAEGTYKAASSALDTYTAKLFGFYMHGATATLKNSTEMNISDFVDGLTANLYKVKSAGSAITTSNYGTNDKHYTYVSQFNYKKGTTTDAQIAGYNAAEWSVSSAFMFYVKLPKSIGATNLYLEVQTADSTGNKFHGLNKGSDAYTLDNGETAWSKVTTVRYGSGNKKASGAIALKAGFEGWVRVPMTSFGNYNVAKKTVFRMDFYFNNYSATDYIEYGGITVVEDGGNNYYNLNYGSGDDIKLNASITKKTFDIKIGSVSGSKTFTTDAGAGDLYTNVNLKTKAEFLPGQGLMFYVEQSGRTDSELRIDTADAGMTMITAAKYRLYDAKEEYWSVYTASGDGKMTIPGGFSGWVLIPYESFTDSEKKNDPDGFKLNAFRITAYSLGGPYGTVKFGLFMFTENGSEELSSMRVNRSEETALTIRPAYTASMLVPDSILGCGSNARGLTVTSRAQALLEGGYLYSVTSANSLVTMDAESALEIDLSDTVKVNSGNGLIFYVSLPEGVLNSVFTGGIFETAADSEFYILEAGNESVWKLKTSDSDGCLALPSGFNGWVRIPFTSMCGDLTAESDQFRFGFKQLGGAYGEPLFGNFLISDNAEYDLYYVYADAIAYSQALRTFEYYEGYVVRGSASVTGKNNDLINVAQNNTAALTPDIADGYDFTVNAAGDEVNIYDKNYEPRIRFTVDGIYRSKLSSNGAVMFYVDLTGCEENNLLFQAYGNVYATTVAGSKYKLLRDGNSYWEDHVSDGYGDLSFEAGFKGWVRIPYSSLKNTSGIYLSSAITDFYFTFKNVGGAYGNPKIATVIQLSNNGDFGYLKAEGQGEKISLYGPNAKTEYPRDDIAVWKSVTDPFVTYTSGESISVSKTVDTTLQDEADSVFSAKSVSGVTPFKAKGVEYSSTNTVQIHGDQLPRVNISSPISAAGGKGLVFYIKVPETDLGTNNVFFQFKTADGRWLSVKDTFNYMIPILEKGDDEWQYVFVTEQRVKLPSGFEGYVYIPFTSLTTYANSITGLYTCLTETDVIQNFVIGVGEYGGDSGTVTVGGIFLSENGIISHNGAYVDGDVTCRDIFTGEAIEAEKVRYSVFDAPKNTESVFRNLAEPTDEGRLVYVEKLTGHSASLVIDSYPAATRYRCDIYETCSVAGQLEKIYYKYLTSYYTDSQTLDIDGLTTATYYTAVVTAFNGDRGLAIYALCPIRPEAGIAGKMYITDDDPYKYDWITSDSDGDEWEYEEIWYEEDGEEGSTPEQTKRKKKILRRKKSGGIEVWQIILIAVGGVAVVAAASFTVIIIVKKKKRGKSR